MAATGKRFKAEQIVNLLREIDVMMARQVFAGSFNYLAILKAIQIDQIRN